MAPGVVTVLAIDPGKSKCGVAVVKAAASGEVEVLHRSVIDTSALGDTFTDLEQRYRLSLVILGDGTTSVQAEKIIEELTDLRVETVDEKYTSLLARKRFFQDNPPRGLRRLIPLSLQTPARPCDDYVAVILAERYLQSTMRF